MKEECSDFVDLEWNEAVKQSASRYFIVRLGDVVIEEVSKYVKKTDRGHDRAHTAAKSCLGFWIDSSRDVDTTCVDFIGRRVRASDQLGAPNDAQTHGGVINELPAWRFSPFEAVWLMKVKQDLASDDAWNSLLTAAAQECEEALKLTPGRDLMFAAVTDLHACVFVAVHAVRLYPKETHQNRRH